MDIQADDVTDDLVHEVVKRAERGIRTNLTRNGEVVAVVLPFADHEALTEKVVA